MFFFKKEEPIRAIPSTPRPEPTPSTPTTEPIPFFTKSAQVTPLFKSPSGGVSTPPQVTPFKSPSGEVRTLEENMAPKTVAGTFVCPDHHLNLSDPTRNPDGMIVVRANNIVDGNELYDKLTIYRPIIDARDYRQVSVVLHEGGGGFSITEPSVPKCFYEEVDDIQVQLEQTKHCELTETSHRVMSMQLKGQKVVNIKETNFFFPDDISCIPEKFGNTKAKIVTNIKLLPIKVGKKGVAMVTYLVFRLKIDDPEGRFLDDGIGGSFDEFEEATNRMLSSLKVKEEEMDEN